MLLSFVCLYFNTFISYKQTKIYSLLDLPRFSRRETESEAVQ